MAEGISALSSLAFSTCRANTWRFQVSRLSIVPFDFSLSLQAMTIEKLSFALPAVFTIGPNDEVQSLIKYATLLTSGDRDQSQASTRTHVQDIVKGIIEGETRVIVSSMTMEEIFKGERSEE